MDADGGQEPSTAGLPIRPPPILNSNNSNVPASNSRLRKRTKTGCLTCRRRRIKCGEERPVCANCIKSKRTCEGYNQRLVFKTAIDGWPNGIMGPASTIPYHTSTIPGSQRPHGYHPEYFYAQQPSPHFGIPIDEHGRPHPIPTHFDAVEWPAHQYPLPSFTPVAPVLPSNAMGPIGPPPNSIQLNSQHNGTFFARQSSPPVTNGQFYQQSPNFDQSYVSPPPQTNLQTATSNSHTLPVHQSMLPTPSPTTYTDNSERYAISSPQNRNGGYFVPASPDGHYPTVSHNLQDATIPHVGFDYKTGISRDFTGAPITVQSVVSPAGVSYITALSPFDLNAAAVEWHTEEYSSPWDSEEDQELSPEQALVHGEDNQRTLLMILELHKHHAGDTSVRDYNTFLYSGFLTQYEADKFASPLKNKHTARVFAHFLSATAPSLSIFERHFRNSSPIFCDTPSENALEGLWTYTLPVMALNNQGLLHAMLSLSSLHISKLQNDTSTPAFQHYAYAIKRINRCVEHPAKRHNLATLAATLLLGFYEVMTADHSKWCCHLAGAARLLQEINYRDMAAYARITSQEREAQENSLHGGPNINPTAGNGRSDFSHVDDELISRITGRRIERYPPQKMAATDFDLQKYHMYQDLFWWFARQDAYQSILAGNRLMLDYHRWADCPPRAEIGRVDAVYGTHDYLFLLFGRIADFATKDRKRKLKVMAANGGAWKPHPDMQLSPPQGQQQSASQGHPGQAPPSFQVPPTARMEPPLGQYTPNGVPTAAQNSAPAMPSFYGLAPMPSQITMPSSYSGHTTTPPYHSPTTSDNSGIDPDTKTPLALVEWNQMYSTLEDLKAHFGPGFQPLEPDVYPFATPYGPAVLYPSYDIAVIWALYYAAHIVALRAHPHMPPFTHVASGVAARQTAEFANLIGRIAAGMMGDTIRHPLTPSLGATYSEMTLPLFIAGIQYTKADQREWLVMRVREIEELTGWASVGMIAQGCEAAWVKAAAIGKGPPYTPLKPVTRFEETPTVRVPRRKREAGESIFSNSGSEGRWQGTAASSDSRGIRIHHAMGLLGEDGDLKIDQDSFLDQRCPSEAEIARQQTSPLQSSPFSSVHG